MGCKRLLIFILYEYRIKSGKFGQSVKFGQRPGLFQIFFNYWNKKILYEYRIQSGKFGQSVKFGQRPGLFHFFNYWNKK